MSNFRHILFCTTLFFVPLCPIYAHEDAVVDHHDLININQTLTLSALVKLTMEKFPDQILNSAHQQEAKALQQRGDSFLAGAANIALRYQDDLVGDDIGSREIETELELPLWNWGSVLLVRTLPKRLILQQRNNLQH